MDRFWSKVDKNNPSGCWLWMAARDPDGYGRFGIGRTSERAHRVAYELLVGPIPDGLVIDHVRERGCRHRHCVNPAHLEPVTRGENVRRGDLTLNNGRLFWTECPNGHPYTDDNVYIDPAGHRNCRTCRRKAEQKYAMTRAERAA